MDSRLEFNKDKPNLVMINSASMQKEVYEATMDYVQKKVGSVVD